MRIIDLARKRKGSEKYNEVYAGPYARFIYDVSEIKLLELNLINKSNRIVKINTGTENTIFIIAVPILLNTGNYLIAEDFINGLKLKYYFYITVGNFKMYALQIDNQYPESSEHNILL
jgi:hypothetical protein